MWCSLLLLGYKPVQHVTVLNTVGNCNTVVSIITLYYNIMGPPSYMRSVVDRNVVDRNIVMRRIPVLLIQNGVLQQNSCVSYPVGSRWTYCLQFT